MIDKNLPSVLFEERIDDFIKQPGEGALMLSQTATHPRSRLFLAVFRPERNILFSKLISGVQCLDIGSPLGSEVKVVPFPLMLEEEPFVAEETRDDV